MSLNYLATRFTCSWPWSIAVMLCDGRIVCGCADPYAKRVLGDLRTTTLSDIWGSPLARELREDINTGGSPFCGDCPLKEPLAPDEPAPVRDLNVAPLEWDVWNHKRLVRSVGHTPGETAAMKKLWASGRLIDVPRHFSPEPQPLYSWWGYRFPQSFERDYGWRFDHVLASEKLMPRVRALKTVKDTRTWERPSDHVPLVVDLD